MKEVFSKGEDCAELAQCLKNKMDNYVSFNWLGIDNPILTGVYCKNGTHFPFYGKDDVRFYIKFCKNEFLRIQMEVFPYNRENIALAMSELIQALVSIEQGDTPIGFPLAIYSTDDWLTSEYAFKNMESIMESLENNTRFDDGSVENLNFLSDINHEFEDHEAPKIKVLCQKICNTIQTSEI